MVIDLTIALIAVSGVILAALINQLGRLHVKEYKRMKTDIQMYKELEEGYIQLLSEMALVEEADEVITPLAIKRRFRKILRQKGYTTPNYKERADE